MPVKPFYVSIDNGSTSVGPSHSLISNDTTKIWYFDTIEEAEAFAERLQEDYL